MKAARLFITCFTLAATFIACKRDSQAASPEAPGVVLFPAAGISIDVGADWKRIENGPGPPICPPTLVGPDGIVRAVLFPPVVSDMKAATNAVHSMFVSDPGSVKDSYRQESFTTDSGVHGEHISHADRTVKDGVATERWSHNFMVQRRDGRMVAISYLPAAGNGSNPVCQMIEKSLKLR